MAIATAGALYNEFIQNAIYLYCADFVPNKNAPDGAVFIDVHWVL